MITLTLLATTVILVQILVPSLILVVQLEKAAQVVLVLLQTTHLAILQLSSMELLEEVHTQAIIQAISALEETLLSILMNQNSTGVVMKSQQKKTLIMLLTISV
jgi:hypothetical protein